MNRRNFLSAAAAGLMAGVSGRLRAAGEAGEPFYHDYEAPIFPIHEHVKQPVKIASIELLRNGRTYLVRTRSTDGAEGIVATKQVRDFVSIFYNLIVPYYLGKDARDVERLNDGVYTANYKLAGLAFWCPVAYVEQSLFDLLGNVAKKPAGELMGGVIRKEIPVYLSGSGRDNTAEEEVEVYVRGIEATGANAMKFKIGGRMSRNLDAYPGRTETLIKLGRKRLGDKVIINTDANGSYNAAKAIEVGKFLQDHNVGFFEEPCPWEELSETKAVADALDLPVACGEQDASLWRFKWMMENGVMRIVQPDLNYNGGFVRAARVARLARKHDMTIVPHNTQTGATAVNILQFASATPNIGTYMEFPWRRPHQDEPWYSPQFPIRNGVVKVPTGPGMGIEFDPDFIANAVKVENPSA